MSRDRAPCRKEINFKNIDHGVCLLLRSDIRLFFIGNRSFSQQIPRDNIYFGNGNNGSRRTLLE